jgi:gliding motility-associated-like protein
LRRGLLVAAFLISFLASKAQTITASDSVGCAPMVGVQFTGISGSTNISWNFNDGGVANILNPVHTFSSPGTYNVTYSATVNGSTVNEGITIKVFGKPTPKFTTSSAVKGCVPLLINFTNQSTGSGGSPIVEYSWAFGDGGVSNASDPSYFYTIKGQYSVSLIVTDANGCDSSVVVSNMITASQKPTVVITSNPDPISACTAPLTVTYNASSSTSGSPTGSALTYSWTFGNGNTSTSATPANQTYNSQGNYTVKLVVTDNNSCSDSTTKPISINNPKASFFVADTVCEFVRFDDLLSTPGTQSWDYGDGQFGVQDTHTYANPGIYFVKLTITSGSCVDDTIRKIVIKNTKADFSISPNYSCSLPQTVNITNTSLNAYTYTWSAYGKPTQYDVDLSDVTIRTPVITVSRADTNMYTIWDRDTVIQLTLIITSRQGCKDTIVVSWKDTVFRPTARYEPDVAEGCFPLTVQFSDSSLSNENIVSWKYLFGDGGSATSSSSGSATHTYTTPGIYYPKLIIVNSGGCIDTSYAIPIRVGSPPNADFTISPTTACIHTPIQFTDQSSATNNSPIDTWHYSTDNGFIMSSCYTDPNPSWSFTSATGPQDITLEVCSRGCCTQITKPNFITIKGPLMEYTAKMDCDTPDVINFVGNFQDAASWTWNFGDGTILSNSTSVNISHTYADTGVYNTSVIGFNPATGCAPDTFTLVVHVKHIVAEFVTSSVGCIDTAHVFDATPSINEATWGNNGYVWLWDDNTPPNITSSVTTTHVFTTPGIHTVTLIVKDFNGCESRITHTMRSSGVTANFTPDASVGCIPWNVQFTDGSVSDGTISSWNWTFGDGGSSSQTNPLHTYTDANATSFLVTLTVVNEFGCRDTVQDRLYPSKPIANYFLLSSNIGCEGDSVHFMAAINNYPGYSWNFGDGETSNVSSPWHVYDTTGTFNVSLTVTDAVGCQKTNTIPGIVMIQGVPQVGFMSSVDTLTERCYPLSVNFTDTSIANVFGYRIWDLGNGSPVVANQTVGTIYQLPGTYPVSLIVSTSFGCKDTIKKTITVMGPLADFTVAPTTICKGDAVTFGIKDTSDVAFYHWDFGDGFDTVGVSPVTHTYNIHPANGQLSATLVFWSADSSCAQTRSQTINVEQVIADFMRNNEVTVSDTAHCLGVPDVFNNTSVNASNYIWNFGDGSVSGLSSPSHLYNAPGTYNVQLAITNSQTGCVDTLRKKMVIYDLPVVNATGGDTCQGSPVQLNVTGGVRYVWTPSTGLSPSDTIANPIATPSQTTTYTVFIRDANNCQASDEAVVTIIQEPITVQWDTTIIIGQFVPLSFSGQPEYIYTWTPTDSLSCTSCSNPISHPLDDIQYTLTVTDKLGCFSVQSTYDIHVREETSIDVPTAFTPNGDGSNDLVFVRGWGIKRLLEFRIYNRFGELVFETTDLNQGWDGTYKGVPQGTETFAYTVKAETYIEGKIEAKKGFVKLLR